VSFGRIEHPLPLARSLASFLDGLSKRIDCRVEDFRGVGFYVVFQDGDTFFVLTSREGRARIRTADGFEALGAREIDGVAELPVETSSAQKELFSQDLRDFLALYRIDTAALGATAGGLDLAVGGSGEEMDTLIEALDQPGVVETGVPEKTILLNLISDKMMYVSFDGYVRLRELHALDAPRRAARGRVARLGRYVIPAAVFLLFVSLGSVWVSERLTGPSPTPETTAAVAPPVTEEMAAAPTTTQTAEEYATPDSPSDPVEDPADDGGTELKFALDWDKSYRQPVTSTPALAGDRVVFGGRDGNLYALDALSGEALWRYDARDGIGASPVVAGNSIVAADYQGNVFSVDLEGNLRWNRKLPGKVVSTPCVGDGEVVVGCYNGTAYALSLETGRVLWRLATGGRIRGSVAHSDGRYYVPSYDGKLYSITAGTGAIRWTFGLGGPVSSSPAALGDLVAIGGADNRIYAVDAETGHMRWRYRTQGPVKSSVALVDGKVLAGSNDKSLYCLDAESGSLVWKHKTGGSVLARPVVFEGHVIFASYDRRLYCLEADTGERVDRFETNGSVFSSPTIGGESVFFGNNNGKFYCVNLRGKEAS
jgi:outer membrane protein assembly factor BamB